MGKFKGVLFDFDGTIMDTNEIILGSWRHVYQTLFQRDPDYKEITWTFGEPLFDSMAHMFPDRDPNEMVELYREYQRHIYNKPIHMFPGIKEVFAERSPEKGIIVLNSGKLAEIAVYDI